MMDVSPINLESLRRDLDALRGRVLAQLGEEDARYIYSVRSVARCLEISGRLLIHVSLEPFSFGLGVLSLGLYKILENLELGHNVLHGQYDFLNDPTLDSRTYEWELSSPAELWKRMHVGVHHAHTNVIGRDPDLGFGYARTSSELPWRPHHLFQLGAGLGFAVLFDPWLAVYQTGAAQPARVGEASAKASRAAWTNVARTAARLYAKDYVLYPLLAGPFAPKVALGNLLANVMRNVWCFAVLHCGHVAKQTFVFFPGDLEDEPRGSAYLRQLLGSSNVEAGPVLAILTGHMSQHIEHHLFPDIPAWRYRQMSPEVRRIAEKHGLPYNTGSLTQRLRGVLAALAAYALPSAPSDEPRKGAPIIRKLTPRAALQPASV